MQRYTRTIAASLLILVLSFLALSPLQGCASLGESVAQIESARDQAARVRDRTNAEIDELALMRESIPDGSDRAAPLDAALSRLRTKAAALDAAIEHADQTLDNAQNPSDPLTLGAQALSPWIPAPLQAPLVLGAALAAALARSGALRRDAKSIVESIDHAKRKSPAFREALDGSADAIRSIQTRGARTLVKKVSG